MKLFHPAPKGESIMYAIDSEVELKVEADLGKCPKAAEKKNQSTQAEGPGFDIMRAHTLLVKKIAHHLIGRLPPCVQSEDLVQAGMIGLLEAIKNYDINKGASFETYATIRIRGSMLDEIRKGDWAPRSVHRNTRRIAEAIRIVENQTGRDARDIEVAHNLNVSLEEYHSMLQDTNGIRVFGFDDVGLSEDLVSEGISDPIPSPLDDVQLSDFQDSLTKGIEALPDRERLVLSLYYEDELNLREVGDFLGVSESRASQIHSQAMNRLQTRLKAWSV